MMIPLLMVSLSTFNLRGLGDEIKQSQLDHDCVRYNMDIIALQETKVTQSYEYVFAKSGNKLFICDQYTGWQRGIGFLVSKRMLPCVTTVYQVSNNIAYIDVEIQGRNGKHTKCRVVNAYGPTSPAAAKNPTLRDDFYDELISTIENVPKNYEIFICGDFNSRIGKLSNDEIEQGLSDFVGRHGIGKRNDNGSHLLSFVINYDLFICNTAFKHKSRHLTTRVGYIKDWNDPDPNSNKTIPFYSMIDYVICRRRFKSTLVDSRAFHGTKTYSDHKLVAAKFRFQDRHLTFRKHLKPEQMYEVSALTSQEEIQISYSEQVSKSISTIQHNSEIDCNTRVDELISTIKRAADKTIGLKRRDKPRDYCNDTEIVKMSDQRHKLLQKLHQSNASDNRTELRSQINKLKNLISKRLKHLKEQHAEKLAEQITSTDESRRMFEAVRELKTCKQSNSKQGVSVYSEDSKSFISSDTAKADALKTWFEGLFTNQHSEPPLEPFEGPPRPLNTPISPAEVAAASKSLKNNRATGPDGVQNELLKFGGDTFYETYSNIINDCFETNTHLKAVGEAVIAPLQKPNKPKGPLKNIRPLTLSNATRKILSLVTLHRIQCQVDYYTGPWQAAYKQGRSCSDIVWCQRMLTAVVMNKHFQFHKMGIDMSSAFDTIKRSTILNLLADAGCSEDEIRLVRFLLSNTVLKVRVNSSYSVEFFTTLGAFQGDSLSGCLFTLVLAGALYHLRVLIPFRHAIPYNPSTLMPLESEYADDVDFIDEEPIRLQFILSIATNVLKQWNLNINCSKTEFVDFHLAQKSDDDAENELWRKSKLLGSYMCSSYDIQRRCVLGHIAFNNYKNVWLQGKRISLHRLVQIYEAMVVSVIMYNCSSWAAPNDILCKLDVCHRSHLRQLLNIKYPTTISNEKLYKVCSTVPLSNRVKLSRWKMFGHILRSPENSPAALSLSFAVDGSSIYRGRRGRHRTNLLSVIRNDISRIPVNRYSDKPYLHYKLTLKNKQDITVLRDIARNKTEWNHLYNYIA